MDATALEPRHDLRLAYRCNGGSPSIHQVAHALGVALNVAEKDCFPHPWGPISFMVRSEAASVRHDVAPELNVADTKKTRFCACTRRCGQSSPFLACRRNHPT